MLLDVDTTIALYIYVIKLWDNNLELDNTCDNGGKKQLPSGGAMRLNNVPRFNTRRSSQPNWL